MVAIGGDAAGDAPFVEELTEEECAQETKHQEQQDEPQLAPEQEEEMIASLTNQNTLKKIQMEIDQRDASAREGHINGKYHYAYSEYKSGLKSLSDVLVASNMRDLYKDDPAIEAGFRSRRRKFCVNAAAACIKIKHWAQGLEACTLVLEEGPDDAMQRTKALFRAGVCARGMGELEAAEEFLRQVLSELDADNDGGDEEQKVRENTKRDVVKQLREIAAEQKRYAKFARGTCSKKNADSIILPKKKGVVSAEEMDKMAEVEEKRKEYVENKTAMEVSARKKSTVTMRAPEVILSEDECNTILDILAERYAVSEVQEALRKASLDHELKFTKGYILRSKKILGPLQRNIFEQYGFWDRLQGEDDAKAHGRALMKMQHSIRYLAKDNEDIQKKVDLVQRLAIGDMIMDQE